MVIIISSLASIIRPISDISSNDTLPTDNFGKTSMNICDIQWNQSDICVVVGFTYGYFCIISRFGYIMKLATSLNGPNYFYVFLYNNFRSLKNKPLLIAFL